MNRIYRVIWSKARHAWVVASELATGRGKNGRAVKRATLRTPTQESRLPKQAWLLRAAILATLLAQHAPTRAADRYWDINDTDPGLGGAGTWDLTNPIWGADDDGVSGPYSAWNNAAFDDAFFTGTAGTVTLGAPIAVNDLNFLVHNYILNGSTLTLGGTTPTIHTPGNTTINSIIAGTAGLTKTGGGQLTLTGTNTFSGGIFLDGGTLAADDDAALGAAGNVITTRANTSVGFAVGTGPVNRTVAIGDAGTVTVTGAAGQARYTGNGNVSVAAGSRLSNDANTYTGTTRFSGCSGVCTSSFTSIADLGIASSLGAPTTVANGTITFNSAAQYSDNLVYLGDGDSSNRNWSIGGSAAVIHNQGTGTLTITGNVAGSGGTSFSAASADIQLLGVISGNGNFSFGGSAGRTVTLGGANTYTGNTGLGATVVAPVLANIGDNSSFGTGTGGGGGLIGVGGVLSYTGAGASTDRPFSFSNGTLGNNGSGALTLTGAVSAPGSFTLGGSYSASDNTVSGVISGAGTLISNGAGTWVLTGANTRSGAVTVQNGTLRAGSAQALGSVTGVTVNGGTLDLNNFSLTAQSLTGTGGTLALGGANLTLSNTSGTTSYAGSLTGSGGLTKLGLSTQTLTGANTYTGPTTIGAGTLNLSFATTTGPTSNILSSSSTLNLAGGNLTVTGGANEANTQTFAGVNITGGTNNISATSATGGSVTLNLGAINRTGGLVDFDVPTAGNITTTDLTLGGWATINNGSSYAKIVGGNIVAFTASDYTVQNNAALWADDQFITDSSTGFTGTVDSPDGTLQLGGLRYTAARSTALNIASSDTLGIDGTILVAPSVGGFNQTISGGSLTGPLGGGTLGIQQNSTGTFTINSQIVDNGGEVGFTKAGTGTVALTATNSTYTGPTVVSQGTLAVASIANGGVASSIGASTADSSNLVLEGGTLRYTGSGATSDRGFTLARSGAITGGTIEIQNSAADLEFAGVVTSADGASLTKTGAGTLSLTSAASDYTGPTTINAGTLSVSTLANGGAVSSIGASSSASSNLVLGGGTLQYTGGNATSDRGFTLSTGTSGIDVNDPSATLTLSGTAIGAGSLRKDGAGTLVLSGTNTYTGATTVNSGVLRAGSTQAFSANVMTLANTAGVTLDLDGLNNRVGSLAGGGTNGGNVLLDGATLTLDGTHGTYSGTISGSGGLTKGAAGTQTMVGCNHSYTGPTTISGFLSVDCLRNGGIASGIGASSNAASNLVFNAGTLIYSGGSIGIDRGFTLTGSGAIDVTAGATTLSISGPVGGAGGLLVKRGSGTLVLSGSNTYTGITLLEAGTLRAGSSTALGNSTGIRMDGANTTLDLAGFNHTVAYLHEASSTANRNVVLGGATLTINSGDGTYSGVISGNGSLIKSVAGTQTLSGCNNSYTGSTRISAGGLTVHCLDDGGANSSIGNSSADAGNLYINGALTYDGTGSTTNRQFTMGTAGAVLASSGDGAVNFTSTAPIAIDGTAASRTLTLRGTNTDNNILSAQINNGSSGSVRVTKTDAGTWVLTNENSAYTGITRIDGGVLSVSKLSNGGVASSIGASTSAAGNLVIGNGSTLRYSGSGDTTNRQFTLSQGVTFIESSGSGALQFTNTGNVTLSGTGDRTIALGGTNTGLNTMGGTIADAGLNGKTTLAKNDSGTWVLTGNNTYTGNTVVNNGNLIIGNGGTTGNAGAGNVIVDSATSTLSINRSDAFNFNGTLSGPGTLAQVGTGTTRLTAASNSIGASTISAGTLEVDGSLTTATMAMTGTSTLNVDGTMQASGGTAALFTGDGGSSTINVSTGATLRANGTLGDGSDTLNLTGTLDTGAAAMSFGGGDDTFTLNDGAVINGTGIDAGTATSGDTLQVNNALARTLTGTDITGFDRLIKQNTGVLTMTGTQSFDAGTQVTAGTLDVDGTLDTSSVALADGTTLNIDGTVHAAGGTQAAITGSTGINTVLVNAGATLSASGDLGGGNDTVTLAGTLNTGASSIVLGAGDDTLTLNDGASISGAGIDAGTATSNDVLVVNNAVALMFDGSTTSGFENLIKQNSGTASMTGSQSFGTGTTISGGTLDIDGTLQTPTLALADSTTLNIDGSVQAAGGTQATITGSTGVNTLLVNTGATLLANGDLGDGSDVVTLAGTLNTGAGALSLGAGDDTLTLNDGAVLSGTGIDAAAGANDQLILNNADALTFNGAATTAFETLIKQNGGIATMTGTQTFSAGTTIGGGTLSVAGMLQTPTVSLADGTTLDVDGVVQAAGATQSALTGSAGANTVTVAASGTLLAAGDLGDGNDVLDVAGTLDTGAGTLALGDGDDSFLIHDGTNVVGTVDGGTGLDTRVYNIDLNADVGALLGFEGVTKTGTGVLSINGPGTTNLAEIEVLGGTLNVASTASVDGVTTTTIATDATLNVDGTYDGSAGNDTFTVAGTVSGGGSIDLGDGDDTLTLQDGAAMNAAVSGGAVGTDSVVVDNANALTFDGTNVADFEDLTKLNTGTATLAGVHNYDSTAIDGGVLDVDGTLNAGSVTVADGTVLNVDGTVQGAGATQTTITGTAGVNTVVVNGGGSLLASGDLGDGNDVLDVAGTLDTGGGTFSLGAGDDTFVVHNTTAVIGTLDAGAGNDLLNVNVDAGNLVPLGSTTGFESLGKSGLGALEINGASDFVDVQVQAGLLDITAGGSIQAQTANVSSGATLNVDGAVAFTTGADDFTVGGTVTGAGSIDMLDGDDELTILDGANLGGLATSLSGGTGNDTLTADIATSATLGGVTAFETLTKNGAGALNVAGPANSSFTTVLVQDGLLDVAAAASITGVSSTTVASGATLNVDGAYAGSTGDDTFTLAGAVSGAGSIDLGSGDDVLTIQEGAALGTLVDAGSDVAGDRVVLNNTSALTLDSTDISGFEQLDKQNTGTVILTGTHVYDSATLSGGTLDVNDTLETATATLADGTTLNVDGTMQGAGGGQAAITGSTGINRVTVSAGATLLASGDLGDGNDVLDVAGTLDTGGGTFSLGAGDDTFAVDNTTAVIGTLDAGAGNDLLNVNVDAGSLVPLGSMTGFESLGKSGLGALEINGASDFLDVQVQAGLLDINAGGGIEAQTASVSSGATLNVDGALVFTAGADDFTVGGTVTGAGTIDMLDGDDELTILDGADLGGLGTSLSGGTGNDTLTANIATSATLGGVTGFETLTKDGTGVLNVNGPASSNLAEIEVLGGTLNVASTASVDGVTTTTIATDATLNVDGTYDGSAGNDTFTVAGTVSGGGSIDLGDGDDTLTLQDGAAMNAAVSGGAVGTDSVVVDNANALTFDGTNVADFEDLTKLNTGTATLAGVHNYDSTAIDGGVLDVDGTLNAGSVTVADGTVLNVDGTVQGAGATQTTITGTAGVNTVVVNGGGSLLASGDLGDGNDVLDVAGTLDTGGGTFSLGAGDDTFVVHDGTNVIGTVVGGAGLDTRIYNIAGVANVGALQEFEGLTKQNTGTLHINGPSTTDLLEVAVEGGTLNIAAGGDVTGVQTTTVNAGATLNVAGSYAGSTGNDTFTVAGTISGAGTIDLGDGSDTLTLQDGAAVNAAINGGVGSDRVVLDNAADFTFDGTNVGGFEALVKQNTGTAALVGAHSYDSTAIDGGTLDVDGTLETSTVALADDATLNIDGSVQAVGATQTAITGTTGVNNVVVNAASTLLATGDLGDGNDVLDVAGSFDIGGGTFFLGAGDDTFVVHDNTAIAGTVDGGDGLDTRVYNIDSSADLGALLNFEGLTKTGVGVLSIQGPGSSDLAEVDVLGGTLNIASTGGIVGVTSATVAAGATLNVDGAFDFTAGGDTFNVAGTITGVTSINMLDGDDELTLSDGADLSGLASPLDGGTGNDLLVANIATTATLGGVSSFENLTKQGAGSLNVSADTHFDTVLVAEGLVDVASDAALEAHAATVSAGATLNVDGDFLFTANGDTFVVAGVVTGAGAIDMLDGDDQLTLRDGADLSGLGSSLHGGDGADTLTADIATQATLGGAIGFETLIKEGAGLVTIAGPADSMFDTVLVREGELTVAAGAFVDPQTTAVDASATMTIDGAYHGTADADSFTLSGTLAGGGTVDLLEGDDLLTVNTGADVTFTGVFDANAASADSFVLAGAGEDSFDASLIGTVFQNFDAFRKDGTGTWRLTGTGSSDWTVAEGTLLGDTESFGGNIDNAATVIFDQANDGTYDHVLSGNGTFIKQSTGTLVMAGTNTFAGNTQVEAGTLQVDGTLPGALTVGSGATLSGIGTVGNVTNLTGGFVAPGTAALPFGTLTITGDYVGGGTVRINTVLGTETSDTGRLLIQGNASGTSTVLVNRWSGDGARTQGDGIEIIQVEGASAPDSFHLGQPVQAGAYQYLLYQGGSADANDWYLRSDLIDPNNPPAEEEPPLPSFRAGVPGYVLGHQANLEYGFTALGNLRARVGDRGRVPGAEQHAPADAWMRVYADDIDIAGNRFAAEDLQMTNVQFGTDLYANASGSASTHFGVMASVGESRAALFDSARAVAGLSKLAGEMQTDAKGIGVYWTHFGTNGGYFDLAAQGLYYSNRYSDQTLTDADQTGWGGTLSAELGAVYALGADWMIEPQLQLAYQRLELDAFDDQVSRVAAVNDDGLRARAGVQLLRAPSDWLGMHHGSPYIGIGAQRDLREVNAVTVGGTTIHDEIPDTTVDVSVGFTGSVFSGFELHLDMRYQKSTEGEKDGVRANFGFRMSF